MSLHFSASRRNRAPRTREQKNLIYFLLTAVAYTFAVGLCSEGYIQAYLLKSGLGSEGVGLYGFCVQISALLAYTLFLGISPCKRGFKKRYVLSIFLLALLPAGLMLSNLVPPLLLVVVLLSGVVYSVSVAYKGTAEYAMVPYLFPREAYGPVLGKSGVLGGVIAIIVTTLSSGIVSRIGFPYGYYVLFSIGLLAFSCAGFSALHYQLSAEEPDGGGKTAVSYPELFRRIFTKKYMRLLFPHLLRGVGMAGMYFFMTVTLSNIPLSEREITLSVAVGVAAGAAGNFAFMLLTRKLRSGVLTLAANIVCGLCVFAVCFNRNHALFFILYFVYMIANTISQLSIPTGVLGCTPNEDLPFMSAMRMLMTSASNSVFILLFGYLFKFVPSYYIMGFAALVFIWCGYRCKLLFTDELTHYQ